MPKTMHVRMITRDISTYPHRDLEANPIRQEGIEVLYGEGPPPAGWVTLLDLGERHLDFGQGLDLTEKTEIDPQPLLDAGDEDSSGTSPPPTESSQASTPRPRSVSRRAYRKATKPTQAKARPAGRRRGAREAEPA